MKALFLGLCICLTLFFLSCSHNNLSYDNPNLLNVDVRFEVNLNLPQYNSLQYPLNPVYVSGYGNSGVIIVNTGSGKFVAYDAADPNVPVEECSTLKIDGIEGRSRCNKINTYNLISGTAIEEKSDGEDLEYTLKPYQVVDNENGALVVKN